MNSTKVFVIALVMGLLTIIPESAKAQERTLHFGVELDVLPYLTGGYFGAIWLGKDHFRGRALYAQVNMPDFIVPDGFTNNKVSSFALLADYFFKDGMAGPWLGAGVVRWDGTIQSEQKLGTAKYNSYLLNGSVGYNFNLGKHFYLSPWAGMSLRFAGSQDIMVDGLEYDPPVLNPELSLKVGWRIR